MSQWSLPLQLHGFLHRPQTQDAGLYSPWNLTLFFLELHNRSLTVKRKRRLPLQVAASYQEEGLGVMGLLSEVTKTVPGQPGDRRSPVGQHSPIANHFLTPLFLPVFMLLLDRPSPFDENGGFWTPLSAGALKQHREWAAKRGPQQLFRSTGLPCMASDSPHQIWAVCGYGDLG